MLEQMVYTINLLYSVLAVGESSFKYSCIGGAVHLSVFCAVECQHWAFNLGQLLARIYSYEMAYVWRVGLL